MDITNDIRRLATIGTFFIVVGWVGIIYTLVAGVLWFIDLWSREAFNILRGLRGFRRRRRPADLRGVPRRRRRVLPPAIALYVAGRSEYPLRREVVRCADARSRLSSPS